MQPITALTFSARLYSSFNISLRLRSTPSSSFTFLHSHHPYPQITFFHYSSLSSSCNNDKNNNKKNNNFSRNLDRDSLLQPLRTSRNSRSFAAATNHWGSQVQWRYKSTTSASNVNVKPETKAEAKGEAEAGKNEGIKIKSWSFEEIQSLSQTPQKGLIIIDVREPTELLTTGRIPTALSMPLNSNPNAIYLFPEAFRAKFGFDKPGLSSPSTSSPPSSLPSSPSPSSTSSSSSSSSPPPEAGASTEDKEDPNEEKVQEVIFYCLAGVRSKKAAELAASEDGWSGVRVGEWGGGWSEWEGRGGRVQRG